MKNLIVIATTLLLLSACTINNTNKYLGQLKSGNLMEVYGTVAPNLAFRSKCASPPAIKIINTEMRNQDLLIYEYWPSEVYITPVTLMNGVVDYINDAFSRSGIKPDTNSTKIINVSLSNIKMWYTIFNFSANISVDLSVPENKYAARYGHVDTTPNAEKVIAYTLHGITWKIINDPVVQDYLLCR